MSKSSRHVDWCLKKAEKEIKECESLGKRAKHRGLLKIEPNIKEAEKHLAKAEHYLEVTEYLVKGKFSGLKDFIFSITNGVDERYFNGERCSHSSEGISCKVNVGENVRLNIVIGEMLKIVRSNKQRHALIEDLMLYCDRDTVAVEVPVWYWNKKIDKGVCGHIDILQVKFGKVWIMDYKPDSEKENFERVMSQLYNYALALYFRTEVSLSDIMCAWFDASRIYSFEPSKVMTGLDKREAGFESKSDGINDKKSNGMLNEQINLKGEL